MKDTGPPQWTARVPPQGGADHGLASDDAGSPRPQAVSAFAQRRFRVRVRDEERALLRRVVAVFASSEPAQGNDEADDRAMTGHGMAGQASDAGLSRLYRD